MTPHRPRYRTARSCSRAAAIALALLAAAGACTDSEWTPAWVTAVTGPGSEGVLRLTAHPEGGVFAAGELDDTLTLGETTLHAEGPALFVARMSVEGEPLWATALDALRRPDAGPLLLAADSTGGVTVAAPLAGRLPCPSGIIEGDGGSWAVVHLSGDDGTPRWCRELSATGSLKVSALAADAAGRVAVVIAFSGTLALEEAVDPALLEAGDTVAAVVAQIPVDSAGGLVATLWRLPDALQPSALAFSSDYGLYLTGSYLTPVELKCGASEELRGILAEERGLFLIRFDGAGTCHWVEDLGPGAGGQGPLVAVDPADRVYWTGVVPGDDGAPAAHVTADAHGAIRSFTAAGEALESAALPGEVTLGGLSADLAGDLFIGGTFAASIRVGSQAVQSAGGQDALLSIFGAGGHSPRSTALGGTADDAAHDVVVDHLGNVYLGGAFGGEAAFGAQRATAAGPRDGFVMRYR